MPSFFGYEHVIENELKKKGFEVTLIYENLDELNWLYRFIYVYFPRLKNKVMDNYYLNKFKRLSVKKFDYILVIRGESLSENSVRFLKQVQPFASYIMYQWDSVSNNRNALVLAPMFDQVFTFDMKDAITYSWKYRPLFFCNTESTVWKDRKYELLFVCPLHGKRAEIYQQIKQLVEKNNLNGYFSIFSKWTRYFKQKYLKHNPLFTKLDLHDVSFKPLGLKEMQYLYARSKIVVDYTHPGQNGFTMRTIESIGANCKLITNNINIMKADFYNPNNILVYQGNIGNIDENFWKTPYVPLKEEQYEYYSIHGWIKDILSL